MCLLQLKCICFSDTTVGLISSYHPFLPPFSSTPSCHDVQQGLLNLPPSFGMSSGVKPISFRFLQPAWYLETCKFVAVGIDMIKVQSQTAMSNVCVTEKYLTSEWQFMFSVSLMRGDVC